MSIPQLFLSHHAARGYVNFLIFETVEQVKKKFTKFLDCIFGQQFSNDLSTAFSPRQGAGGYAKISNFWNRRAIEKNSQIFRLIFIKSQTCRFYVAYFIFFRWPMQL